MAEFFTTDSNRRVARAVIKSEREPVDVVPEPDQRQTPLPFQFRRFELAEDLEPGTIETPGTAKAWFLKPDGEIDDEGPQFDVVDMTNSRRGRANGKFGTPNDRGSQGTCYHPHDVDRWEIVDMQPHATMIKGQLKADLVKATGSFDIDTISVMSPPGAIITDTDPASSTFTVSNRRFDGDDGDVVIVVWDEAAVGWVTPDVMCPV